MTTVFWDLETDGVGLDCGITCGVVLSSSGDVTWLHSRYGELMSPKTGKFLLDCLEAADKCVSYNGTQFDFSRLYRLTQDDRCKQLAKTSIDLLLSFGASHGYWSSMNSFAEATFPNDTNKTADGAWASTAWFNGSAEQVLEYCEQDTAVLAKLYNHAAKWGSLDRLTKAGRKRTWVLGTTPGAVDETAEAAVARFLAAPPDTSWMSSEFDKPDIAGALEWAM